MLRLFSALIGKFRRAPEAELPIREELYSIERLEQYVEAGYQATRRALG